MRVLRTLGVGLASAVLLSALAGPSASAEVKSYDLRGPAPVKGMSSNEESHSLIKDAVVVLRSGQAELKVGTISTETDAKSDGEIVAVDGRDATKVRRRIITSVTKTRGTLNDEKVDKSEPNPLTGEWVVSERRGKEWANRLEDASKKPTAEQKKELDDLDPPQNDDALFPAKAVPVGHRWDSDAAAVHAGFLPGSKVSDVTGKATSEFRGLEMVGGEECARVESDIDIKGKVEVQGKPAKFAVSGKRVLYRSLKTGENLRDEFTGKMTLVMQEEMDGVKAEIELTGPFTYRSKVTARR